MKEPKLISSVQNPLIKKIIQLKEKSRERKKTGLFVAEGKREIDLAMKGGYPIDTLVFSPEIMRDSPSESLISDSIKNHVQVSAQVYEKVAHRGTTEGILAILEAKDHSIGQIQFKNNHPLILVAQAPEKPGNIGALLRTADAAALDAVFIADPKSDLYNPNSIRSSLGCVFTQQIGLGSSEEIIAFLKEKGVTLFCAALSASKNYTKSDFTGGSAIVVGAESTGLTDNWLESSDQNIIIPMQGKIDSMNVSVSAAILIFEAKRQRGL